jgi:hypothetical protein
MTTQIREHKKIIPLALIHIMEEETDETHALMMSQLQSQAVQRYGINIDRRTVYATVRLLNEFGYDIRYGRPYEGCADKGYYLASRQLSEEDAVSVLKRIENIKETDAQRYERIRKALVSHFSRYQQESIRQKLSEEDSAVG